MAIRIIGSGNQSDIIDMVKTDFNKDRQSGTEKAKTTDEVIETIEGGFCYMLSMEWLREKILNDNNQNQGPQFNIVDFNNQNYVANNLSLYKQIANNFYVYSEDLKLSADIAKTFLAAYNKIFTTFTDVNKSFVDTCSGNKMEGNITYIERTSQGLKNKVDDFQSGDFLLGFCANDKNKNKEFGHKTAFSKKGDGTILFYDPNFGVIEADEFNDVIGFLEEKYFKNAELTLYELCEVKMK